MTRRTATAYERLVRYYLRGKDLKTARRLLDRGLERFPRMRVCSPPPWTSPWRRLLQEGGALCPGDPGARPHQHRAPRSGWSRPTWRTPASRCAPAVWTWPARNWEPRNGSRAGPGWPPGRAARAAGGTGGPGAAPGAAARPPCAANWSSALGGGMRRGLRPGPGIRPPSGARPPAPSRPAGLGEIPVPSQADLPGFLGRLRAHLDVGRRTPRQTSAA